MLPIIVSTLAAGFLNSCLTSDEPFLIIPNEEYRAELIATVQDGFISPDGILRLEDGTFLLNDERAGAVEVLKPGAGVKKLVTSDEGFKTPEDIVMDEDGNIYFTDDKGGGVWMIEKGTKLKLLAGKDKGLISTEGLALSPWGTLLVGETTQHKIFEVTRQGSVTVYLGASAGIKKPESFAFDKRGYLYIADDDHDIVYRRSPDGSMIILLDKGDGLKAPESIACSGNDLYINDDKAGKVYRFRNQEEGLEVLAIFRGKLKNVQGITVTREGDIFLTIQGFPPNKSFIMALLKKH